MNKEEKMIEHLEKNPTDHQTIISLLKLQSKNLFNDYNLEIKRKRERMEALKRKKSF